MLWSPQQIFTHSENIQDYKNSKARFKPQIKTPTIPNENSLVTAEEVTSGKVLDNYYDH